MSNEKHICSPENAKQFANWIENRGGLFIWNSADLSNPGMLWTTPARQENGEPTAKQNWRMEGQPARHITSADDVVVQTAKELKRFHVGTKRGGGLSYVLTDAATARVKRELTKARETSGGKDVWYEFDYSDEKNCVIMVADETIPLSKCVLLLKKPITSPQ